MASRLSSVRSADAQIPVRHPTRSADRADPIGGCREVDARPPEGKGGSPVSDRATLPATRPATFRRSSRRAVSTGRSIAASALSWVGDYVARAAVTALVYQRTDSVIALRGGLRDQLPALAARRTGAGRAGRAVPVPHGHDPLRPVRAGADGAGRASRTCRRRWCSPCCSSRPAQPAVRGGPLGTAAARSSPGDRYVSALAAARHHRPARPGGRLPVSARRSPAIDPGCALLLNAATFGVSALLLAVGVRTARTPALTAPSARTSCGRPPRASGWSSRTPVLRAIAVLVFGAVLFAVVPEGLAAAWAGRPRAGDPTRLGPGASSWSPCRSASSSAARGHAGWSRPHAAPPADPAVRGLRTRWPWCPPCSIRLRLGGGPARRLLRVAVGGTAAGHQRPVRPGAADGVPGPGVRRDAERRAASRAARCWSPARWPSASRCRRWSGLWSAAGVVLMAVCATWPAQRRSPTRSSRPPGRRRPARRHTAHASGEAPADPADAPAPTAVARRRAPAAHRRRAGRLTAAHGIGHRRR